MIFASKFNNITKGVIRKNNVPMLNENNELERQIALLDNNFYKVNFEKPEKESQLINIKVQI